MCTCFTYSEGMEKEASPLDKALAVQIRIELATRDWSQKDLAAKIGVTRETLNKYMKGRSSMPMPVFAELAATLGYSPRGLMELVQDRIPAEDRWF